MALLQCNFFSDSLKRIVPIQVILPTDKPEQARPGDGCYKTLYLLHGMFGNCNSWVNYSRIQLWAQDRNLAVVMPSGENKFYIDHNIPGEHHGTFIHKELVEFTRRSFPLSKKREDTFIGGLSMGGYGAIVNALHAPETFSAVCALSSALIIDYAGELTENTDTIFTSRAFYEMIFGNLDEVAGSDYDYNALAEKLAGGGAPVPKVYMACGTQDDLYDANRVFKEKLISLGYDVAWEENDGRHDWDFWDMYIKKALDWLPLDYENISKVQG